MKRNLLLTMTLFVVAMAFSSCASQSKYVKQDCARYTYPQGPQYNPAQSKGIKAIWPFNIKKKVYLPGEGKRVRR
jgi:hypothetical protein